jgi:uncharacterized tellurite resistance protein B-like protein
MTTKSEIIYGLGKLVQALEDNIIAEMGAIKTYGDQVAIIRKLLGLDEENLDSLRAALEEKGHDVEQAESIAADIKRIVLQLPEAERSDDISIEHIQGEEKDHKAEFEAALNILKEEFGMVSQSSIETIKRRK